MSENDNLTVVALLVSFVALIITVGQLLQTIFGTAEGFRRANKEIIGVFAQSRDRVFHWTELRFETKFSTPHFTFHNPVHESSLLSPPVRSKDEEVLVSSDSGHLRASSKDNDPKIYSTEDDPKVASEEGDSKVSTKCILAIGNSGNRLEDLNGLIRSSTRMSTLQWFLNGLGQFLDPSNEKKLSLGSDGFSASWLVLLERLYEDEKKFNQNDSDIRYIYKRRSMQTAKPGPDCRQVRYHAIESCLRSWDLLPPDVVRPLASINLGDLLTLCCRLRITVQDLGPRQFSAEGEGHNFSPLQFQGLGMVVQYRYDRMNDPADTIRLGNGKFTPCEQADKLAFGIVPKHPLLGINDDWKLLQGAREQNYPDAIKAHLKKLGVAEEHLRKVTMHKDRDKNDVWFVFADTLLFLAPFMLIDGLGIVKFQPPLPQHWYNPALWRREGRMVLHQRLNEFLPDLEQRPTKVTQSPLPAQNSAMTQLYKVGLVFNYFKTKYTGFDKLGGLEDMIMANAYTTEAHKYLQDVMSAAEEADRYLASVFNKPHHLPTYTYLVAAQMEMALSVHATTKQQMRDHPANKDRPEQQKTIPNSRPSGFADPSLTEYKVQTMHRFVDHAMDGTHIIDLYRDKTKDLKDGQTGLQPAILSDEQIRAGWYTMMLRACLWGMAGHPIWRPNLPYPSRYWQDNTLVLIT